MNLNLRVLQICAVDFTVTNFLRPLIRFLERQAFDVTTVCSPGEYSDSLREQGFNIHNISISRSMNIIKHALSLLKLSRFIALQRFHIVHTHTPIASIIGRIAARLARVPVVIYTAHGFYFHERMSARQRHFHVLLEKFGAFFCDFILTQSEEDRLTALREHICPEHKIAWIGNGVDLARFDPAAVSSSEVDILRREFDLNNACAVVGIIGRMVREKGYYEFFNAAARILERLPDTYFLVIGDQLSSDHDASKTEILSLVDSLGIREHVRFVGMRSDIPQLLSLMDIYTLPSYREGMPRSIIEAMAMEKPVVATDIRGCREEVVDRETGYLVPVGDSLALAERIIDLLEHPEKSREFGICGRRRAVELFDERLVLQRQLDIYHKLIEQKIWHRRKRP